jgi:hypothetical protein
MSAITVLGATRTELMNNTRKALEGFQKGQPVKRDALVRQALATVLGQNNEHLPTAYFADDNAAISERLSLVFAQFPTLQDWGTDGDTTIERVFEERAWDENADEKDITLDYRLIFDLSEKEAYVVLGKNYGSGTEEITQFSLASIPKMALYSPVLDSDAMKKLTSHKEVFAGLDTLYAIHEAIASDIVLSDVFLASADLSVELGNSKKELSESSATDAPSLSRKEIIDAVVGLVEERHANKALESEIDVVSGAVKILSLLGDAGTDAANTLTFMVISGRISDLVANDEMHYIVKTDYDVDGMPIHTVERSAPFSKIDKIEITEAEDEDADEEGFELDSLSASHMKQEFAWNSKRNTPVFDVKNRLVPID